ncbi:SRPBCC family protein [Intrasporangium mesophilum]
MSQFSVVIDSELAAAEAWRRVLDLRMHSRVIPLTTVRGSALSADSLTAGSQFVARTAAGPVGFDDAMTVDEITAPRDGTPGVARIHKGGKVIRGSIVLRVSPRPPGSRVEWSQEIWVWGVPALLHPVVTAVARQAYAAALRRLLAQDP